MTLRYSTIGMLGAAFGMAAAYKFAPEVFQYSEQVRLIGSAGIGAVTGAASYLGSRVSVELFGGNGYGKMALALAFAAGAGYAGYEFSREPAGNLIREWVVQYGANDIHDPAQFPIASLCRHFE